MMALLIICLLMRAAWLITARPGTADSAWFLPVPDLAQTIAPLRFDTRIKTDFAAVDCKLRYPVHRYR